MAIFSDDGHDPLVRSRPGRREIDADLCDVAELVHQEFDGRLDPRVVDECLHQVAARFAGAPIRVFVPLLVRRFVREELRARHGQVELTSESRLHMPNCGGPLSHTATQWPDELR